MKPMAPASPPSNAPATHSRRLFLQASGLALVLGPHALAQGAGIVAVRVWPSDDYSRVTIESDRALKVKHQLVGSPPRLAVDIEGLTLSDPLRQLVAKVHPQDPNIAGIRVGQNAPQVVRMVVDLKQDIKPQVFTLKPVAKYRHRLVFDLYPAVAADPLDALIAQRMQELGQPGPLPSAPANTNNAARQSDDLGDLIARQIERANALSQPTPAPTPAAPPPPVVAQRSQPVPRAPAQAKGRTDRLIIVALDPGHGGEDPGAIGPGGTREKDVVLQIARRLRDRINKSSVSGNPMRAYLTRDGDFFVPLATRVDKARRVGADLFISIHADAFMRPEANGASVYALSQRGASSTAASWLAAKENEADLIGGVNINSHDAQIQHALLDMSTAAQIRDSLSLGSAMLGHIGSINRLHKPQVERANFAVLRNPDVPSVLVETAFISNPQEERKLRSASYQNQLADALMSGIQKYFAANPPLARSRQA